MSKSMLIIGEGTTNYGVSQIVKQDSLKLVKGLYGDNCPLTEAFKHCLEIGMTEVYLANVKSKTGYVDLMHLAKQHDFTYIVPLGIHFSDKVFNKELKRQMTYTEVFMRIITHSCNSIIIMTDNHASLYEDIDTYLNEMKSKIKDFKYEAQMILENGRQLWFTSNNLSTFNYSNVTLGAMMMTTDLPYYPKANISSAIFDIDDHDVEGYELIYFKNNRHTYNSVENFINFHQNNDAYKIAPIDMVIRKINQEMHINGFSGKLFNNQIKLRIKNIVQEYLEQIKGFMIRDYDILHIQSSLEKDYTYTIVVHFSILPMNSLETCEVIIEV